MEATTRRLLATLTRLRISADGREQLNRYMIDRRPYSPVKFWDETDDLEDLKVIFGLQAIKKIKNESSLYKSHWRGVEVLAIEIPELDETYFFVSQQAHRSLRSILRRI